MIDVNNILQVNGTVIAGILILLTIKSFKGDHNETFTRIKITPKDAVAYVIIPFSISAIIAVSDAFKITTTQTNSTGIDWLLIGSAIFTVIGFVYLAIVIFAISKMAKSGESLK
ncbi:MAG: hypothetical protein ACREAD_00795 [Nitrosopumilaceae archaeon]